MNSVTYSADARGTRNLIDYFYDFGLLEWTNFGKQEEFLNAHESGRLSNEDYEVLYNRWQDYMNLDFAQAEIDGTAKHIELDDSVTITKNEIVKENREAGYWHGVDTVFSLFGGTAKYVLIAIVGIFAFKKILD